MIDYDLLIISIFALLFFIIVGGTILLFPLSRKLGHLIEARTRDRTDTPVIDDAGLRRIVARLDAMEEQIVTLTERQEVAEPPGRCQGIATPNVSQASGSPDW
jgi:hypothetical protein